MHLSTEEPAASMIMEPFGEVGGDVPEYFSSQTHFAIIDFFLIIYALAHLAGISYK